MKKWIIITLIVLLLLIASVVLLPYAAGLIVQNKYPSVLAIMSRSSNVHLKLLSYHRHWFDSTATLEVKITHPSIAMLGEWLNIQNQPPYLQFIIKQKIDHGPFLRLSGPSSNRRWLFGRALIQSDASSKVGNMNAMTLVHLNGSLLSVANASNIVYQDPTSDVMAKAQGFTGIIELSADLKKIIGSVDLPNLTIESKEFKQYVSGFKSEYRLNKTISGLFLGRKITELNTANWISGDNKLNLQLNNLSVQSNGYEQKNKINYQLEVLLGSVGVDNGKYGPQQLNLAIKNVDAPSLVKLVQELNKLQTLPQTSSVDVSEYNQALFALASKGLQIDLKDLNLVTAWGNPKITASLKFNPQPLAVTDLLQLIPHLHATVHAQLPKPVLMMMIQKYADLILGKNILWTNNDSINPQNIKIDPQQYAQQQINQWLENKWVIPKDGNYEFDLLYQDNKGVINEMPMKSLNSAVKSIH